MAKDWRRTGPVKRMSGHWNTFAEYVNLELPIATWNLEALRRERLV